MEKKTKQKRIILDKLTFDIRNKLIQSAWEKYKPLLEMKDLAAIFRLPLPSVYRIIKRSTK